MLHKITQFISIVFIHSIHDISAKVLASPERHKLHPFNTPPRITRK